MDGMDAAAPESVGLSAERLGRIGGWMRRWVDSGRLPGLSVTVLRHGCVAYQGLLRPGRPGAWRGDGRRTPSSASTP